ncbi:MAG: helix-turn-helix transcriptional regulator [Syntrophobacterales bacterium]|jgi:transcriptional regulator with XRE-family HTH domain
MKIGEYIKQKRSEKGFEPLEFAENIGLSVHTLYDLEEIDEDEINGITIPEIKAICRELGITPREIYGAVISDLKRLSLSEIIKRRRKEKELSIEAVSDSIGYDSIIIKSIEDEEDLKDVCMDALKKLACELDLSFELLLEKI